MSTKDSVVNARVNARVRERAKNGIPGKLHNTRYVKEPVRDPEENWGVLRRQKQKTQRITAIKNDIWMQYFQNLYQKTQQNRLHDHKQEQS